jgi:nucleoside-diphosphate-sugar epimerase
MEVDLSPETGLVVVTGAGGFIGRAVCAQLPARGLRVRGLIRTLDRHTAARPEFLPIGDLAALPEAALVHALRGARAVVHLAARGPVAETASTATLAAYRRANVEVTQRVPRAAAAGGVAPFVFASSVKVNGEMTLAGRPFTESDPPDAHDDYATSKWEAERALEAVTADTGLRVTALRLPLTYGSGARANFARLARVVRHGVPLPFAGIDNRRSLLGIENLVGALVAVLADDAAGEGGRITPYLLADAVAVSTPGLVRALAAALNVEPRLFAVPTGLLRFAGVLSGHSAAVARLTTSLEVDSRAFRTRFGWTPPCTLAQGLAEACAGHAPAREPSPAAKF